ncbi:hypothetical protein C8R43DRAFT_524916 [Mycena crocata]|nr:hypothetical protein C8R43DRAFT_524916 [Mycena crocata]
MAPPSFTFPDPPTSPPSLARLLASNDAPCTMQSSLASAYIDQLECQISLADEAIVFLLRRRAELMEAASTHKAILSPIRRLPAEILGEIFSFAVDASFHFGDISEVSGPASNHAPWLLTRVCRHWAAVALATPALWSMVFLDLDRVGERGAVPMTKLCLQRSGTVPLTVKIFYERDDDLESNLVLDTVIGASERWRSADLNVRLPLLLQLATIHGHLSALTTLTISIDLTLDDLQVDPRFWDTFAIAPNLTSLCAVFWDDYHLRRAPFSLPWEQLTRLSTTFTSNTEVLSLLEKLPAIVECKLQYEMTDAISPAPGSIRLPHLRSLTLQMEEEHFSATQPPNTYPSLLDFLETPSLERLTAHLTADVDAVLGLLLRSSCAPAMRLLQFHSSAPVPHDAILHLTGLLPALDELEIGDFNGTLLPRSSVPAFICAFAYQWLGAQAHVKPPAPTEEGEEAPPPPPRKTLRVRIIDRQYSRDISREMGTMHKDGLFVVMAKQAHFRSVIMDGFD